MPHSDPYFGPTDPAAWDDTPSASTHAAHAALRREGPPPYLRPVEFSPELFATAAEDDHDRAVRRSRRRCAAWGVLAGALITFALCFWWWEVRPRMVGPSPPSPSLARLGPVLAPDPAAPARWSYRVLHDRRP